MKHIAVRNRSMRKGDRSFTTPGLGDRVHQCLLAYNYSKRHNTPVTLHLHGQQNDKERKWKSWPELMSLFPEGSIQYVTHDNLGLLFEDEWLDHIRKPCQCVNMSGVPFDETRENVQTYYYKDVVDLHPNDPPIERESKLPLDDLLDASDLCLDEPMLQGKQEHALLMPDNIITAQFDTMDSGRQITPEEQQRIMGKYQDMGYHVVVVGGAAQTPGMKNHLTHIGYAMSKAKLHIGVDSGMMHMALLYMKRENIHVYSKGGFVSHHILRGVRNGMPLNPYA